MKFEETKNTLLGNEKKVFLILGKESADRIFKYMYSIEEAMHKDDLEAKDLTSEEIDMLDCTARRVSDCIIESKLTPEITNIFLAVYSVLNNYVVLKQELFGTIEKKRLLESRIREINILLSSSKTIAEQIELNKLLLSKIKQWLFKFPAEVKLADNYYQAYSRYLENKDYDDNYSIDFLDEKEDCACKDCKDC